MLVQSSKTKQKRIEDRPMKQRLAKQLPISTMGGRKTDVRTQFAALCFRIVDDAVKVLMITSRGSKRWIIPKGWPMDNLTPADAVAQEAWEEAGVQGKTFDQCLGIYSYKKEMDNSADLPCVALVYPIKVKSLRILLSIAAACGRASWGSEMALAYRCTLANITIW